MMSNLVETPRIQAWPYKEIFRLKLLHTYLSVDRVNRSSKNSQIDQLTLFTWLKLWFLTLLRIFTPNTGFTPAWTSIWSDKFSFSFQEIFLWKGISCDSHLSVIVFLICLLWHPTSKPDNFGINFTYSLHYSTAYLRPTNLERTNEKISSIFTKYFTDWFKLTFFYLK